MRNTVGLIAAACLGIWSSAMATDPPAPAAAATPATTPASAAAEQTSSTTTAPKTDTAEPAAHAPLTNASNVKVTAGDAAAAAQLKRLKAAGYKPTVKNGEVVFCRKETQLGSRFETMKCGTADDLEQQMIRAQDTLSNAQRSGTVVPRGE